MFIFKLLIIKASTSSILNAIWDYFQLVIKLHPMTSTTLNGDSVALPVNITLAFRIIITSLHHRLTSRWIAGNFPPWQNNIAKDLIFHRQLSSFSRWRFNWTLRHEETGGSVHYLVSHSRKHFFTNVTSLKVSSVLTSLLYLSVCSPPCLTCAWVRLFFSPRRPEPPRLPLF